MTSKRSFTLVELLIVIGILAVLSTAVVLVLNPSEMIARARDSTRISDLQKLNRSLGMYQADGKTAMGSVNRIYISIPDTSSTCANLGLPALPSGWSYGCAPTSTLRRTDGTGWVPVNFASISFGSPIASLPVDPINSTTTSQFYTYVTGSSWALTAVLQSAKHAKTAAESGGVDPSVYTIGTNPSIAPFARGLVGYWRFDESSGTTAADSSGSGNTGTINGTVTLGIPGVRITAVNIANTVDSVINRVVTPHISTGSQYTLAAWIRHTRTGIFLSFGLPYISTGDGGAAFFSWWDGLAQRSIFSAGGLIAPGSWAHVAATHNGSVGRLYINGAEVVSGTWSSGSISGSLWIGVHVNTSGVEGDHDIDEVRIYNRALSADTIRAIFEANR